MITWTHFWKEARLEQHAHAHAPLIGEAEAGGKTRNDSFFVKPHFLGEGQECSCISAND